MSMKSYVLIGGGMTLLWAATAAAAGGDAKVVDAVKRKDPVAVQALVRAHADVNVPDASGATALQWSSHWDDLKTADLLIKAGARVDAADSYGVTPLSLACLNGSATMVEKLLMAKANPNVADNTGETALMACARSGSAQAVKSLLIHGADLKARERSRGQTALLWASAEGQTDVVRSLLEAGADVHERSDAGYSALLLAAREAHVDVIKVLLAAGADVNEAAKDGTTALVVTIIRGHTQFAEFLLNQGANPNLGPGFTALHWAVGVWDSQLSDNSNGITSDNTEWSSFGGLKESEKLPFVKLLLAHGADVNAKARRSPGPGIMVKGGGGGAAGYTPFLIAAKANNVPVMRELVAHGADPKAVGNGGVTALMLAAGVGHDPGVTRSYEPAALEAVKLCYELGNDVNAANAAGDTALHGAAWRERADSIVQFLADHGANLDAKNKRGWTALVIAEGIHTGGNFIRSETTTALLRKLGASPSSPDVIREPQGGRGDDDQ